MTNGRFIAVCGVVMLAVTILIVIYAAHRQNKAQAACEQRGGVYFQTHGGYLCLNPEALK